MISVLLQNISNSLLLPLDQISAAFCLLLSFPFAFLLHFFIFRYKSHRAFINFLCVLPTYFFLYICFYVARDGDGRLAAFIWDILSIHLPIGFVYFALKFSPFLNRNPLIIFALLLLQVSYHHISRQLHFYNQYTVNVTGPLMILIIKLSSFVYDVHDGKIKMNRVGLDNFVAWCLLFAGFFTGPVVMFDDFDKFCSDPDSFFNRSDVKQTVNSIVLRGRKRRATFLILSASLLLIFGLLLQPHFPVQNLLSVSKSHTTPLLHKIIFMHLSLLSWRLKYYVAWSLAEGALVIIGLGYQQIEGKIKWNRYQNVNFMVIETACDFRTIISEWNVSTNRWLNQYIYQRLGRTFRANLSTYLVSAFWHGFYPGYYFTFVSGALYTASTRSIYKSFTWPLKQKYRRLALYIPNYLLVNYFAAPFALQTFSDSWDFCKSWYFYGHIFLILSFLTIKLIPKQKKK